MRATVLSDNIESGELRGEWGMSVYIEYDDQVILLDAGASSLFAENAEKLGLSLEAVDVAVLSHAHFDHANGIPAFFERNGRAKFFIQKSTRADCYIDRETKWEYIGIPEGLMEEHSERIELVDGLREVAPGVFALGHTTSALEQVGLHEKMYRKVDGAFVPDDFAHEQSLVFDTPKGLVIFNSCSHAGAGNIIREAVEAFPGKPVVAFVGGFHLFNKTEDEVRAFARQVRDMGVEQLCTGHCTGDESFRILKEELGDALEQFNVGLVMKFETD